MISGVLQAITTKNESGKMLYRTILLSLFLFTGRQQTQAQDTLLTRIMAARDDSAKVVELAGYAHQLIDDDKVRARKLYAEVMRLSDKFDYPYWNGKSWFFLGYMHSMEGKDAEAIRDFNKALEYFRRTAYTDQVASCYINIAAVSGRMGNTDEKIRATMEAIRLLEPTSHKNLLMYAYNSMGVLFYNLDEFDKGLGYFRKSVDLGHTIKDSASIVNALFGISNCLSSQKKFEEALPYAEEALSIATAKKDAHNLSMANTAFTEIYSKWGKSEPLIRYAQKVIEHSITASNVQYQLIGYMAMGDGLGLAGRHRERIDYLQRALKIGAESGTVIQLDDIYKGLSDSYVALNDYKPGFEYYRKYVVNRDSVMNEKSKKNVAELEMKYQTSQKERQLIAKDAALQQKNKWIIIVVAVMLLLAVSVFFLVLQNRNKRKLHKQTLLTIQKEHEVGLLERTIFGEEKERARIARELHDGISGMLSAAKMHLSAVQTVPVAAGFRQAMELIDQAAGEVRKTAHNLLPEPLLQYGLDEALQRYCNSISSPGNVMVEYHSLGEIPSYRQEFALSVYRIAQELVHNALKHAGAAHIFLQLSHTKELLTLTVEDDGKGFEDNPGKGAGLSIIQNRVKMLNGTITWNSSAGNGTSVYAEFEIEGFEEVA